jgi:crotonobetainyl-CoA:carnitine CoA-transferase CaiB-like acyl-CoA transferase
LMSKLPLENITVLDFATILAGPVSSTFLADFGAEVIKVEIPERGDNQRHMALVPDGRPPIWLVEARNKKCITLDLHKAEGQKLAHRLVEKADVAVFNFRPGKTEEWNIGPQDLHKTNPNLIILQVSAYGQTGPYRKRTGFDRTAQTFASTTYVTGYPEQPPVRSGYALVDYMTAYMSAFGVMTALYNRDANQGGGEVIDATLIEAAFRASEASITSYSMTGVVRERLGNRNPGVVPAGNFETKDGRDLVLNANTDRMWNNLTHAMGMPELLDDPRFANKMDMMKNQDELYDIIGEWVKGMTAEEAMAILEEAGVPADYMRNIADLAVDPHMLAREAVMEFDDPDKGKVKIPGVFPKFTNHPGRVEFLGRKLGADNEEIYGGLLGMSAEEIADLKTKGVI